MTIWNQNMLHFSRETPPATDYWYATYPMLERCYYTVTDVLQSRHVAFNLITTVDHSVALHRAECGPQPDRTDTSNHDCTLYSTTCTSATSRSQLVLYQFTCYNSILPFLQLQRNTLKYKESPQYTTLLIMRLPTRNLRRTNTDIRNTRMLHMNIEMIEYHVL